MKKNLLLVLFSLLILSTNAQNFTIDKKLQNALKPLIDSFHGFAGVYVRNLKTNKIAAINADTLFPTASIIKVPILVGVFDAIQKGKLTYHQPLLYKDSLAKGGSGLMQFFKDSVPTSLDVATALMIGYSDNSAALWCQDLCGGGIAINKIMDDLGFKNIRVNSRTPGREAIRTVYGWGHTTPREMAELLALIREGKVVSRAAGEEMYRIMSHIFYNQNALSQIPPYIQAASKQGMVDESRSELVLVNAPHGDYVFYVATKNNKDQRWENDNEASVLERKISSLLWNYFEPKYGWTPQEYIK
ncbi:MAG: class A beta-lactamase-related serine hydrolase [Chitinophagaceae bacterium]|jgi:beta-lactamase class A|nr:class A beta-lactamase-related serine hydrolase [Chitinophagaceae bacterium]